MTSNVGILSSQPADGDGLWRLVLPGGRAVRVDASVGDETLAAEFGLDRIDRLPKFSTGLYLDGPLAGQTTRYAPDVLGATVGFALPPRPGGLIGTYEVVKLSDGDWPAELRLVEIQQRSTATGPTFSEPERRRPT